MLVAPPFKPAPWMLRQRRPLEPALSEAKGRRPTCRAEAGATSGRFKISPSSIFEDLRRNRMAQSIGFIGLGIMGQPMALNLVKAGYKVTAFNRTRSKAEALE